MGKQLEIDGIGEKWRERSQCSTECVENFEECVQGMHRVVQPILALQALSIESDVPVGCIIQESEDPGDNSIQAVCFESVSRLVVETYEALTDRSFLR